MSKRADDPLPESREYGFMVSTIYGGDTRLGLVVVELRVEGEEPVRVQIVPSEAQDLAASLAQAAETAEQEEMLMAYLDEARFPLGKAAALLNHFRGYRENKYREGQG